jgi:ribonucleoside-diphosphate reductase alpha chain
LARLAEEVAKRLNQVSGHTGSPAAGGGASFADGIAAAIAASPYSLPGFDPKAASSVPVPRGIYHATDAMREMYDMGDAPSCSTCGAIMVRNGSCYRCMSCGSTSGCS